MTDILLEGVRAACSSTDEERELFSRLVELGQGADRGFILGVDTVGRLVHKPELTDPDRSSDAEVYIGVDDVPLFSGFRLALEKVGKKLNVSCDEDALHKDTEATVACATSSLGSIVRGIIPADNGLAELHGITSSAAYVFKIAPDGII